MKTGGESNNGSAQLANELVAEDKSGSAKLLPIVYDELRRIADDYLRQERRGHTLQATALVHEAYVALADQTSVHWQSRAHFLGVAAVAMRRILVDSARRHARVKRGGGRERLSLSEVQVLLPERPIDLVALDEALTKLAGLHQRQSRTVELRFFGGLTVEETAEVLTVSPRTVKADWRMAKAWLLQELSRGDRRVE
ncbi:MAG TPA: sigma-70 family RNA polymerase sigma factor [Phycisphaerae bacterium]|jgi:RNA polymerase sigma factor (TIGR02999 family)